MAKNGKIQGVGVAHRKDSEYLKAYLTEKKTTIQVTCLL